MAKLALIVIALLSVANYSYQNKLFKLDRLAPCRNSEDNPVKIRNVTMDVKPTKAVANGELIITQDIPGPMEMEMTVTRCNLDRSQCEQYDTLYIKKMCNLFDEQDKVGVFGKSLFKNIMPPLHCPLKQGTYKLVNGVIDLEVYDMFPIGGYHWQLIMNFTSVDNKTIFCVEEDVTIMDV